jgi:hypothetical protein
MKFEVTDSSTERIVSSYEVSELSVVDFREWYDRNEITVRLDELLEEVTSLTASDAGAESPDPISKKVRFYVPTPISREMLNRLAQAEAGEDDHEFEGVPEDIEQRIVTPPLGLSMLLLAVVKEILRNHFPPDSYRVRISDG